MLLVIAVFEPGAHVVDNSSGRQNEENFHGRVVDRNKVGEEIEVTREKYKEIQFLRFQGNACSKGCGRE